ncbi:MAG: terpene cyclase/mutase family protein [Phycisphaerales bacterium]|nr:terpene cyclase/mutase family protein [Phycisphaerales bacterium]
MTRSTPRTSVGHLSGGERTRPAPGHGFLQYSQSASATGGVRHGLLVTCIAMLALPHLATAMVVSQDDGPPGRDTTSPVPPETRKAIEQDSSDTNSIPLNPRIDASRITELPTPTLPTEVVIPTPPLHRTASERSNTTLDQSAWTQGNESVRRGLAYLAATQSRNGSWFEGLEVIPTDQSPKEAAAAAAVTALGLKAFAQAPNLAPNTDAGNRALDYLRSIIEREGFDGLNEAGLGNYVTSAVVMGLAAVGSDTGTLMAGVDWLKSSQWDGADGLRSEQDWYGGAGYGNRGRPDLSNTQMMLDALYDAGVSPEEPTVQRALVFLSRTQNLKATNPAAWAQAGNNDGGFIYTPANNGESMASQFVGEGRYGEKMPAGEPRSLRSYGSMTYAGFKSLLYAGLDSEDPRVKAALKWASQHWTLEKNPGVGQQGYYYYVHAMARALRASGLEQITDGDGVQHNWRQELIDALVARQRSDGSWMNSEDRWEEGRPDLATIYATLAIEEALKPNAVDD